MAGSRSSVGVELEFVVAVQQKPGTFKKPAMFQDAPGGPIVLDSTQSIQLTVRDRMLDVIREAIGDRRGDRVVASRQQISNNLNAWHLNNYTEWIVKRDMSVMMTGDVLSSDPNLQNFRWYDVEVTSPPLYATDRSWDELRRVVDAIRQTFWVFCPDTSGLHIHYGRGIDWIPFADLRRIAAFIFAADPILIQMQPEDRITGDGASFCHSNRLYGAMAHGSPSSEVMEHLNARNNEGAPETVSAANPSQNPKSKPKLERGTFIFNRGSLPGYTLDEDHFRDSNFAFNGRYVRVPGTVEGRPVNIPLGVRELLTCTNAPTLARLMRDQHPARFAYNFLAYDLELYRRVVMERGMPNPNHQNRRTIEFRQNAGTMDPDEVIAHAKVVVRLCEYASTIPLQELWKVVSDLHMAESHRDWYDVFDLLTELDLVEEARVIQRQIAKYRGIDLD
ncbi:hypothetical protein M426DRAFT_14002 [Hypoxylon sp. CI-4A]|nr:hypothetical protein M426DRAFT_14002 [Hypoxylon sp. CI-4A]